MKNFELAKLFHEMADLLEIQGDNAFRVRAYQRAAQNLESLAEDVGQVARRGELLKLPGIGKDLASKITEYLGTGGIADLETMRKEVPRGLLAILEVRGLGPKTARLLRRCRNAPARRPAPNGSPETTTHESTPTHSAISTVPAVPR